MKDSFLDWWDDLHFTLTQKRSLLIVAAVVLAASFFFIFRADTQELPPEIAPIQEVTSEVASDVTIDVAGGVKSPGVYTLPSNSRVIDAVKSAGGLIRGADASDINLARILKDGEQVYIYPPQSKPRFTGQKARPQPRGPFSLNRASAKELETLDGIGPVLAARIINFRKANGPFTSVEDLLKVPGIGSAKFAQFKEKLRV